MNTITIIKPLDLYSRMRGISNKKGALFKKTMYFVLPSMFLAGLVKVFSDGIPNKFVGILFMCISIIAACLLFSGGEYKPQKSFFFWRISKEIMFRYYKYLIISCIAIIIVLLFCKQIRPTIYLIPLIPILYYIKKSFTIHEDVDYVTNNDVSELFGLEIDEKIQASYQNFSTSSIKEGSNMILLTDKKVLFAFYDGNTWAVLNKEIKDIVEIGWVSMIVFMLINRSSSIFYIRFSDKTSVELHMDLYDKLTSNPDLFFKKFLITLDTFLLGKTNEIIVSRRRVSVNRDSSTSVITDNKSDAIRAIDISSTILDNLRDAAPIEAGRILEF